LLVAVKPIYRLTSVGLLSYHLAISLLAFRLGFPEEPLQRYSFFLDMQYIDSQSIQETIS
jgi:hypothetical protein